MTPDLRAGALVRVRGERWRLARVDRFDRCAVLTLEGRDAGNRGRRLRVLDPFDRPAAIRAGRWRRRARRAVLGSALAATAAARPAAGLWSAAGASIDLHPYQLEPAMAVAGGATRVLLADAVGLGKTIQAGLVLAELRERGWVERALVVCPAGLRASWIAELAFRFGIEAAGFGQEGVAESIAALPPGINPWATAATAVTSIDYLKRADVLAAACAVPFDLLIVDEAHHLTPGTDRGRAIERLARQTPWCVFASATPHSGDPDAFEFLCSLGSHADPITTFRRGRADAGIGGSRRTHTLAVHPPTREAALLAAVDEYAHAIWNARGRIDPGAQLLAILLARRAASSVLAIERSLTRRLSMLDGRIEPVQPRLPWEESDDDGEEDSRLSIAGLEEAGREKAIVAGLLAAARGCGPGSKIRRALRLAARAREPVILFTEFRDTLDAVLAAIPAGVRAACIHGAMPAAERERAVAAFNGGHVDVLAATDAAGEGLNLHQRCRLVIDLELPWNPLRLEQRIGRVDRIGQRRRAHAVRLYHPGGIEARVLRHLQLRQRRADLDVLPAPIAELEVARAVLDERALQQPTGSRIPSATVAGAPREAARLEHARAARGCRRLADPAWSGPGRHRTCIAALRRVAFANDSGSLLEERLEAWRVDLSPARRGDWRRVVAGAADRLPPPAAPDVGPRQQIVGRIEAIRRQLAERRTTTVQPSLFDRRVEERALREEEAIRRADAALQRCLSAVAPGASGIADHTTFVAAWPLRLP